MPDLEVLELLGDVNNGRFLEQHGIPLPLLVPQRRGKISEENGCMIHLTEAGY